MSYTKIHHFVAERIGDDERALEKLHPRFTAVRARRLAEIQAKKGVLLDYSVRLWTSRFAGAAPDDVAIRCIASVYSDHPDYREAWRIPDMGDRAVIGEWRG